MVWHVGSVALTWPKPFNFVKIFLHIPSGNGQNDNLPELYQSRSSKTLDCKLNHKFNKVVSLIWLIHVFYSKNFNFSNLKNVPLPEQFSTGPLSRLIRFLDDAPLVIYRNRRASKRPKLSCQQQYYKDVFGEFYPLRKRISYSYGSKVTWLWVLRN